MASAGRVLPIPKGEWDSATTYTMLDMVRYQQRMYIAKRQNTNVVPTDGADWMLATAFPGAAEDITYDNTVSEMTADDVQEAINELNNPTFTEASTRTNIASGESVSTLFGKIKKWFADLGAAAFKGVDSTPTSASANVVTSGGVYTADMHMTTATVATGGWTAESKTAPSGTVYAYKYAVAITGMTANSYVDIDISSGTYSGAYCVESIAGYAVIRTATQPSTSLSFRIYYQV